MMHKKEDHAALEAKSRPEAEQGNAEAQFELAKLYNSCSCSGTDRKVRKTEALRWFRKAAEQGHVEAQYRTGTYYQYGLEVVTKDPTEANAWFLKSAEKGHTGAMMKLGRYREAAELGDAHAQYQMGDQSEDDDPAEAMRWYLKAFNHMAGEEGWDWIQGKAAYAIAKMHKEGKGVPKDDKTAVIWLFKAAEKRDTEARYDIAERYAKGLGVPKDTKIAAEWYVKAESGDMGFDPTGGDLKKVCKVRGVPLEEMLAAYRKAAETSDGWAMHLADLYKYGWGVPADEAESQKWHRKAALGFAWNLTNVETEGGAH